MTAHFGATLGGPGVVVVAGTGSIVLAKGESGRFAPIGAGAICSATKAVPGGSPARHARRYRRQRRSRPRTALVETIRQWFAVGALQEIIPILHDPTHTKEKLAALAEFLSEKMPADDTVFREVLVRAGQELAMQALAAIRSSGLESRPAPVYLVGSVVTKNSLVRESFIASLQATIPIRLETAQLPPVLGAAAMALRDAGAKLTSEVITNLRSTRLPSS
jgi:N-acetylglucosamine kinase-like BadF-type ATPase